MTSLYLAVACSGYAAFGNSLAGSIMTVFTHPAWLVDLANAMVGGGWGRVGRVHCELWGVTQMDTNG